MKLRTIEQQLASGRVGLLARTARLLIPFYRLKFLAGASSSGVLERLAGGPLGRAELMRELEVSETGHDAFSSWLDVGVKLGVLRETSRGMVLRSRLARALASPRHDAVRALVEELATLHGRLLVETPRRAVTGRLFTLDDQDGELIARSSRVLEPLIAEEVLRLVPASGPCRLLEVGCGSGVYVRHAAGANPELSAVALELQSDVARQARENLERWGLADRVHVEVCDVRRLEPGDPFDLVTLHQNIYYFRADERPGLLRHLRSFLAPGGRLLVTTACSGGSAALAVLDLWAAATEGCGRLPGREDLERMLQDTGFTDVDSRRLLPGEAVFSFNGTRPVPPRDTPGRRAPAGTQGQVLQ